MPGNRSNSTSGRPINTPSSATMVWQLSAASKPPPSALPWTRAMLWARVPRPAWKACTPRTQRWA